MTVTEQIRIAMSIQESRRPDTDPGDVDISVQDDSAACCVVQNNAVRGFGGTVEDAVEMFYQWVVDGE